jgi:hypothetical protein
MCAVRGEVSGGKSPTHVKIWEMTGKKFTKISWQKIRGNNCTKSHSFTDQHRVKSCPTNPPLIIKRMLGEVGGALAMRYFNLG